MLLKDRLKYAEEMLEKSYITTIDEYMTLVKGDDIDQLEDKIAALQQYLLYKKMNKTSDYTNGKWKLKGSK